MSGRNKKWGADIATILIDERLGHWHSMWRHIALSTAAAREITGKAKLIYAVTFALTHYEYID